MPEQLRPEITGEFSAGENEATKTDKEQLILRSLHKVRHIAERLKKKYGLPTGVHLEDLISAGNEGLVEAAEEFIKTQSKLYFSLFASRFIENAIENVLIPRVEGINRPELKEFLEFNDTVIADLRQKYGREPEVEEVAKAFDMSPWHYRKLLKNQLPVEIPIGDLSKETIDRIPAHIPKRDLDKKEINHDEPNSLTEEERQELLKKMNPKYRIAIEMSSGLRNGVIYSSAEIGKELGVDHRYGAIKRILSDARWEWNILCRIATIRKNLEGEKDLQQVRDLSASEYSNILGQLSSKEKALITKANRGATYEMMAGTLSIYHLNLSASEAKQRFLEACRKFLKLWQVASLRKASKNKNNKG